MVAQINVKKGKIDNGLDKLLTALPDGLYNVTFKQLTKPKTIAEYRKYYFYLVEMVLEGGGTGYTKTELHNLFKKELLLSDIRADELVTNYMDFIKGNEIEKSTKILNIIGWANYIEKIRNYIKEKMNIYV